MTGVAPAAVSVPDRWSATQNVKWAVPRVIVLGQLGSGFACAMAPAANRLAANNAATLVIVNRMSLLLWCME